MDRGAQRAVRNLADQLAGRNTVAGGNYRDCRCAHMLAGSDMYLGGSNRFFGPGSGLIELTQSQTGHQAFAGYQTVLACITHMELSFSRLIANLCLCHILLEDRIGQTRMQVGRAGEVFAQVALAAQRCGQRA